jgi:hypothetical protein
MEVVYLRIHRERSGHKISKFLPGHNRSENLHDTNSLDATAPFHVCVFRPSFGASQIRSRSYYLSMLQVAALEAEEDCGRVPSRSSTRCHWISIG